jgi:hypothetical protein
MKQIIYTPEEDKVIKDNWNTKTLEEIGNMLNKHKDSVRKRGYRMGLPCKSGSNQYTNEEDKVIAALWSTHTAEQIAQRLGRTKMGVSKRAQRIGIIKPSTQYKLYLNEDYIMTGNAEELAKATALSVKTIWYLATPRARKRMDNRKYKGKLRWYHRVERVETNKEELA